MCMRYCNYLYEEIFISVFYSLDEINLRVNQMKQLDTYMYVHTGAS